MNTRTHFNHIILTLLLLLSVLLVSSCMVMETLHLEDDGSGNYDFMFLLMDFTNSDIKGKPSTKESKNKKGEFFLEEQSIPLLVDSLSFLKSIYGRDSLKSVYTLVDSLNPQFLSSYNEHEIDLLKSVKAGVFKDKAMFRIMIDVPFDNIKQIDTAFFLCVRAIFTNDSVMSSLKSSSKDFPFASFMKDVKPKFESMFTYDKRNSLKRERLFMEMLTNKEEQETDSPSWTGFDSLMMQLPYISVYDLPNKPKKIKAKEGTLYKSKSPYVVHYSNFYELGENVDALDIQISY